jgi:hypothetical protein
MAKGGSLVVGAVAPAAGTQLAVARARAEEAERAAAAVGVEAEAAVQVGTSLVDALVGLAAEHDATMVVTGWHKGAADAALGGRDLDLVALADTPVLAVLGAGGDVHRVLLALDRRDLDARRTAERALAVAVAGIAAGATRGNAVVVAPDDAAAREIAALIGGGADVVVDGRSRREAVEAIARADDLVVMPTRPGGPPFHRDAVAVASLAVGCTVAVPARAHTAATLVTGTPVLVGSRSG